MRKLLVFVALFAMVGVSYAQDTRVIGVYMDANSGTIASSEENTKLFNGTCVEVGVTYTQGFENISWMKLHTRARAIIKQSPQYDESDDNAYLGNGSNPATGELRARVGLQFAGAGVGAFLSMDTRGLLYQNLGYTFSFGSAGSLNLQQEMCLYAVPKLKVYEGENEMAALDALYFNVTYSVPVAEQWTYMTAVKLRWTGGTGDYYKDLANSMAMRWENRITYRVTPKLSMYGQIRYQIDNLVNDSDIKHDMKFNASVSYSFDMTGL